MRIAGIDLSTHAVDIVTVPAEGSGAPVWHRFPLAGHASFDRARSVRDSMPSRTSVIYDDVLAVGIEDPAGHGANHIYRVQGAVLACLPIGVLVHPWRPGAWKKAAGLKGNATKEEIEFHVRFSTHVLSGEHTGRSLPSDYFDALCIALATRDAIRVQAAA